MRCLLTYATFESTPYFADRACVALVSTQFLRAAAEERFAIPAYGFAPARVELLIEAMDARAVASAFLQRSRQLAAWHVNVRMARTLWQRGPIHRPLAGIEESRAAAERILSQPISGSFAWDRLNLILNGPEAGRPYRIDDVCT